MCILLSSSSQCILGRGAIACCCAPRPLSRAFPSLPFRLRRLCRGQPDKLQWIDCIALGSASGIGDTASAVLAVARCSGSIELLSPLAGELLGTIPATPITAAGSGSAPQQQQDAVRVRGLHLLWGAGGSGSGSNGGGAEGPPPLPSVLSVTEGGTASVHAPAAGSRGSWEQQASWQVPAGVCCTAYDPATGRLAVGCQGTELRLYDCASGDLVFAFKGGKPNSGAG